jgi:hypothetical protein
MSGIRSEGGPLHPPARVSRRVLVPSESAIWGGPTAALHWEAILSEVDDTSILSTRLSTPLSPSPRPATGPAAQAPRAAGWSEATLCCGPTRKSLRPFGRSAIWGGSVVSIERGSADLPTSPRPQQADTRIICQPVSARFRPFSSAQVNALRVLSPTVKHGSMGFRWVTRCSLGCIQRSTSETHCYGMRRDALHPSQRQRPGAEPRAILRVPSVC